MNALHMYRPSLSCLSAVASTARPSRARHCCLLFWIELLKPADHDKADDYACAVAPMASCFRLLTTAEEEAAEDAAAPAEVN